MSNVAAAQRASRLCGATNPHPAARAAPVAAYDRGVTLPQQDFDRRFLPGFGADQVPGEAVYTGEARDHAISIDVFDWTKDDLDEIDDATVDQAATVRGRETVSWVNVSGIHDAELVRELGTRFGIHPLTVEDIVSPRHRPKIEHYPDYVYLVLTQAHANEGGSTRLEQVSVVLGNDFLLTFQEEPTDVFDEVRDQLRVATGRIRTRGHDYLAYALMDAIVARYVHIIEGVSAQIEEADNELDDGRGQIAHLPARLHDLKRELMALRKAILPLRDAVSALVRDNDERIDPRNWPYFRDLHDHLVQLVDSIDVYREIVASILGLHLSMVGQRTNEEMRVLTVIATIFIPLTFIAGVYGMNFDDMPELHLPWAYPMLWVAMAAIAALQLLYFRRRRWL